jgi:arsenate reductase-like glutaredoxin family protein
MPQPIAWQYTRRPCETCQRAAAYLTAAGVTPGRTVNAVKVRYGPADALALLAGAEKLIAVRGKKVETFVLGDGRPDDDTLLAKVMGPTANLRAPTIVVGTTVVVGFSPDAYDAVLA